MKTKFTTLLLALAMVGSTVLLNSCKKDDDTGGTSGGGGTNTTPNSMTGVIGTKILDPAGLPVFTYESSNGSLSITTNDKDQSTTLAIYLNVNSGNDQAIGSAAFGNVQIGGDLYTADAGSIKLTTNDKTNRIIAGTFSFSSKNSQQANIDVSNGKFYIKY